MCVTEAGGQCDGKTTLMTDRQDGSETCLSPLLTPRSIREDGSRKSEEEEERGGKKREREGGR